jgi:hypothetical protein
MDASPPLSQAPVGVHPPATLQVLGSLGGRNSWNRVFARTYLLMVVAVIRVLDIADALLGSLGTSFGLLPSSLSGIS